MTIARKRTFTAASNPWIETLWQVQKDFADHETIVSRLSAFLHGHLIFPLNDFTSTYVLNKKIYTFTGSHLLYPQSSALFLHQSLQVSLIGAELSLGTAYLLKKAKALCESAPSKIAAPLRFSPSFSGGFDEAENLLSVYFKELNLKSYIDRHYILAKKIETQLKQNPDQLIGDLCTSLGFSQRTLERSFKKVSGYSLKTYYNIYRFNLYLEHMISSKHLSHALLEEYYYFYDQSHCIKQFKNYVGTTPQQLTRRSDMVSSQYEFKSF